MALELVFANYEVNSKMLLKLMDHHASLLLQICRLKDDNFKLSIINFTYLLLFEQN